VTGNGFGAQQAACQGGSDDQEEASRSDHEIKDPNCRDVARHFAVHADSARRGAGAQY